MDKKNNCDWCEKPLGEVSVTVIVTVRERTDLRKRQNRICLKCYDETAVITFKEVGVDWRFTHQSNPSWITIKEEGKS